MTRIVVFLLLLGACAPPLDAPVESGAPAAPGSVWLAQDLAWGWQCEPGAGEGRDDLLGALRDAGLTVEALARRGRAACRACSTCPAFPETVWVRVDAGDVELARAMGYVLEQAPDASDIVWP